MNQGSLDIARNSSELAKQGSITDQMLGQGTKKLNQGHGYPGSEGSGRGSEQTGLVRAWWRLTEGSVRAAALVTEARSG